MSLAEEASGTGPEEHRDDNKTTERAAVAANPQNGGYRPARERRRIHLPHPRNSDGWSMFLAVLMALGVPLWAWISYTWGSPDPDAKISWVLAVPWMIALFYTYAQVLFLLTSIGRSDDLGMSDTVVSGITLLAVFGTIVVVTVLAAQGSFHFGAGKGLTLLAMLMATAGEFLCTAWMRFLVNRRYFASVPSSAPAGGNFGGGHHQV